MTDNDIISIETRREERGKVLGVATVNLSFGIAVTVNVINGNKGIFIGMPSRKSGDNWEEVVRFTEKSDFFVVSNAVKKAWQTQQNDTVEEDSFMISEDQAF